MRISRGIFFFKQKTAYEIKECDWSSDVCSSDLHLDLEFFKVLRPAGRHELISGAYFHAFLHFFLEEIGRASCRERV